MRYETRVINDPLGQTTGQTHGLASNEHYLFSLEICFVLKSGDGLKNRRTTCA